LKQSTTEKGQLAEDHALTFLEKAGLILLQRNYRSSMGEVDLIMLDGDTTVFVEVRSRKKNSFLNTVETIDQRKQNRIIHTSQHYLQQVRNNKTRDNRFDVILISGAIDEENIEWIKNAFDA
jgi:putative endonuclease